MQPPKRALAFLRWFCREDYLEEVEGDLTEVFRKKYAVSPGKAKWYFTWSVLLYCRPEFWKSFKNFYNPYSYDMLKSFLKIGFRNLVKNNGYAFINIGGLALGMTVTMFIGLWIYDELSFDKYHKNYDTIGELWAGGTDPDTQKIDGSVALQLPMAAVLKNNYQHYFKHIVLAWWIGDYTLSTEGKKITKTGEYIEAAGPEMLTLKMIHGTYEGLKDPHSILLSQSTAKALFGDEDPMNKMLKIDNRMDVKVTGVYEDIPRNNRMGKVEFFAPWDLWFLSNDWIRRNENNWDNRSFNIYVQLQPGIGMEEANAGIRDFYYKNLPKDFLKDVEKYKPFAQVVPMNTWHLYSEFKDGKPAGGRITFVWLFGLVGTFVLLLACINFINLSTARSEKRAREVGVRKSLGSAKKQLVFQFLSESFLVVVLAFIFSMIFAVVSMRFFNELTDKDITLPTDKLLFWVIMIGFLIATGFFAGLYPAFYLSAFQPVKVLKGALRGGRWRSLPRKILVVVQFTVSVVLIIGTVVVYLQIEYARNRPIGYDRNGLITLPLNDPGYYRKHEALKNEVLNTGFVTDMAYCSYPITTVWNNSGGFIWTGRDPEKDNDFAIFQATEGFGKTVGWKFVSGRDFSKSIASDTAAMIINESAAKYIGLKNPIGEVISHENDPGKWTIVGVIQDMVMQSPYEPVKPTIFFFDPKYQVTNQTQIKLKPTVNPNEAVSAIEAVFRKIVPSASFDFKFVDEEYALKFSQEQRLGKLAALFAILAIFISCLGLFGLASYVAEQRTKEIGIRKVLGASVMNLWRMLSKDFVVLVLLSCFIAIPLSYYLMSGWLKKYTYHTEVSWWIFVITVGGALLITLVTVSFHAVKAALMNPVKSLRSE